MILLSFTNRSKEYGYIIWPKKLDEEMKIFTNNVEEVFLVFNGKDIGIKRVDWKYRRISIGYKYTRYLRDEYKELRLDFEHPNKLFARLA